MRSTTRKAYTMADLLVSLVILSALLLCTLPRLQESDTGHYRFLRDYLDAEIESYTEKKAVNVRNSDLHFNKDTNINVGETLHFGKHWVIVHLANGYLTYG